jgi:hypothetical protein
LAPFSSGQARLWIALWPVSGPADHGIILRTSRNTNARDTDFFVPVV